MHTQPKTNPVSWACGFLGAIVEYMPSWVKVYYVRNFLIDAGYTIGYGVDDGYDAGHDCMREGRANGR